MDIKDQIAAHAAELLASGQVKAVVGLRHHGGHLAPQVFTDPSQLAELSLGDEFGAGRNRFSLARLLTDLARQYPRDTFGIIVRGCDERALKNLLADERVKELHPDRVRLIGFCCPQELAETCACHEPYPTDPVAGTPAPGVTTEAVEADPLDELAGWLDTFNRCVKCLGCKSVCPVCGCKECTMEMEALVPQRQLPIDPSFLLTRAMHMADRCVYCGLCEQACPADIPLRDLYRLVGKIAGQYGGIPGLKTSAPSAA